MLYFDKFLFECIRIEMLGECDDIDRRLVDLLKLLFDRGSVNEAVVKRNVRNLSQHLKPATKFHGMQT